MDKKEREEWIVERTMEGVRVWLSPYGWCDEKSDAELFSFSDAEEIVEKDGGRVIPCDWNDRHG